LFAKKQVAFVFSYVTSLAFHWGIQKNRGYEIASFPEGHPVHVELAAVPATCRECDFALEFVRGLATPANQSLIMRKNFMLPVLNGIENGTVFAELPNLKIREINPAKGQDLSDWDKVFKN
jgi:thiamine transport system substrate-binding protein